MSESKDRTLVIQSAEELASPVTRRKFVQALGLGSTIVLMPGLFACEEKSDPTNPPGGGNGDPVVLDLGNDIGIFNYAYALEQLEAAFYAQVVAGFAAAGITDATERSILTDIRDHEVIHREFFRAALGSARIPDLSVSFGGALGTRLSVLQTARTFEDLGVSAYNGAGKYLSNPNNLLAAGKIVSVEARHASVIRDLLDNSGREFAGDEVVNTNGLDVVREPADVLALADPFITTSVAIGTQPTS